MKNLVIVLVVVLPILAIMATSFITFKKRLTGNSSNKAMRYNLISFVTTTLLICAMTFMVSAENAQPETDTQTQTQVQAEEATSEKSTNGLGLLAAGLVTGLAGIGGGIAVAAGAPAAISAVTEDPKSFGKSLIFVALGESIALYGLVISILILNKV